jgi:hypothetical protein
MGGILPAIQRMQRDALKVYRVSVLINQSTRTAPQAQAFHVCHMFLHNFFAHLRPRFVEPGARTIAWSHLSDPAVSWALIDDQKSKFLMTRDGRPAKLVASSTGPAWQIAPDRKASTRAMAHFLTEHHVRSMAAPGQAGCGEPCVCGGHASKHLTAEACDLANLPLLGRSIRTTASFADDDDAVDSFLHGYGLWRPLAHLAGNAREQWHVEGIPTHHKHLAPKHLRLTASHHKTSCP